MTAKERYDRDDKLFDGTSKINAEKRMRCAIDNCKGNNILEIGCGLGYLSGLIKDNVNY